MNLRDVSDFIVNCPHRPWCEQAGGNIYSSGGKCNCGRDDALDTLDRFQEILSQVPVELPPE